MDCIPPMTNSGVRCCETRITAAVFISKSSSWRASIEVVREPVAARAEINRGGIGSSRHILHQPYFVRSAIIVWIESLDGYLNAPGFKIDLNVPVRLREVL